LQAFWGNGSPKVFFGGEGHPFLLLPELVRVSRLQLLPPIIVAILRLILIVSIHLRPVSLTLPHLYKVIQRTIHTLSRLTFIPHVPVVVLSHSGEVLFI